jgi:hypothetical protein
MVNVLIQILAVAVMLVCADAKADTVYVKYRELVDLKSFSCTETVSSCTASATTRETPTCSFN